MTLILRSAHSDALGHSRGWWQQSDTSRASTYRLDRAAEVLRNLGKIQPLRVQLSERACVDLDHASSIIATATSPVTASPCSARSPRVSSATAVRSSPAPG